MDKYKILLPRNISIQLLAARIACNISKHELAKQLNISIKIIEQIELHQYIYDKELVERIVNILNIKLV